MSTNGRVLEACVPPDRRNQRQKGPQNSHCWESPMHLHQLSSLIWIMTAGIISEMCNKVEIKKSDGLNVNLQLQPSDGSIISQRGPRYLLLNAESTCYGCLQCCSAECLLPPRSSDFCADA